MKNILSILFIALLVTAGVENANAQKGYKIGYAAQQTETYADTVEIDFDHSITISKLTMDTTTCVISIDAGSSNIVPGAQLFVKITASSTAAQDTITWLATYFTHPVTYVDSLETDVVPFIYDGSKFIGSGAEVTTD